MVSFFGMRCEKYDRRAFRLKTDGYIGDSYEILRTVSTELNVTETAALLGFKDDLYFSRLFKKMHGTSLSEYKKHMENRQAL